MSRLVITKTKRSPLRKLLIPAMVVVVIAALGMIILFKQTRKDIPSEISNKPLLAIPYFFNDTGDEKLDIFEKNCAQWLINDLYSSRLLNVMPMDKLYGALRKLDLLEVSNYASEDIKKIAQEGGANVVVLASLSTIGNTLRIDFSLYEKGQDHEFDLLASDSVSSRDGDMTPGLIDEMTRKIKSNFNFSGTQLAEDIDYAVGDVTTSNPEALKHYIEGVQLEAKYQHDDAIMALEKAIELDPDFAMAYLEMAKSYQNKIQPVKAHEFREKAYALRERLTERERLLVAASLFDTPGAIEAYKRMVELYPDDYEANHQLAFRYMNIEENDLAIQHWEQAIRIDPKRNFRPYWWLINVYGMIGDYDKARYSLERASQNLLIPPHRLPEWYGDIYLVERRYDLAEREYRNVPEDAPNYIDKLNSLGTIHYFRDEFDKAEIIFKECVDAGGDSGFDSLRRLIRLYRTRGQVEKAIELYTTTFRELRIGEDRWDVPEYLSGLAASYLNAGNPEAAFETYQEAIEDIEKIRTEQQGGDVWVFPVNIRLQLHGQTNALIEMGKLEEAENYMIEIEDLTPEDQRMYRRDRRRRNLLEGKLLSAKGEFSRAIEKLEMAVSLCNKESSISWRTDQANYFNALAEAYEKSDEGDKAISAYEKIILLTVGRFNWGEIYAQAYYRLGMIYQQMGLNTKALENLEKFIELWKDCDPQFQPLIEDARKRIGSLSTP